MVSGVKTSLVYHFLARWSMARGSVISSFPGATTWVVVNDGVYNSSVSAWTSLVAQLVKNPPAMRETWIRSLVWEDPLGKRKGHPLQYSGLENSLDCIVHGGGKESDMTEWLSLVFERCSQQQFESSGWWVFGGHRIEVRGDKKGDKIWGREINHRLVRKLNFRGTCFHNLS